ncbi:ParA family protein [Cytophagaceae bacterium DM2B3-1]|uniref:ParA family protein n=1 Tax=Xanthocytophaga flava TaxID=3048013 RepID=A0ABT7CYR5_9BACT|nr:ParA family protein [Xanthocytophaga flavus]MDJ1498806.1 ParA family protein [Xanthocytophaga flavus]
MSTFIGVLSQKGGVGKSTISRLIAREYAAAEWKVKIADMDISQATCTNWNRRRMHAKIEPEISVEAFGNVSKAFAIADHDLVIFDGAPHATRMTLDIAKGVDLIIIPTGVALDDLEPSVKLAHELKANGIDKKKICFALNGVGNSSAEIEEAVNYIADAQYSLLKGAIPDKTAYRKASDFGRALTETPFESLNATAAQIVQSVVEKLQELS